MPRVKRKPPKYPDREKGQRSRDLPMYVDRYVPPWRHPKWQEAEFWRQIVLNEPFAIICRETLIANILSLDWKIEPRDTNMRDELKGQMDYYTQFIEHTREYDYTQITEWVLQDVLDIPFGGAIELGYENDNPENDLVWIRPIDGGTLFPTRNKKWPVGQSLKQAPQDTVYFPDHAINRIYMSPRTNIKREGWGMAPPEKVYLSLELLRRGDIYYANMLLDTPEVGILDLADMSKSSAEGWVKDWRDLLQGIDPFKIPVLYEHESPVEFIDFNRSPHDMTFDKTTMRYAAICAAGYGMSLSDIGIQATTAGGETLAGSIRQERRTRRTGIARLKKKMKYFWDQMLPSELQFKFIDLDDELSVALGRARLADATAFGQLIDQGVLLPEEARQQIIADGLITISIPEALPEEARRRAEMNAGKSPERPSMLGRPVKPTSGGTGEVRQGVILNSLDRIFIDNIHLSDFIERSYSVIQDDLEIGYNQNSDDLVDKLTDNEFWNEIYDEIPELSLANIHAHKDILLERLDKSDWCYLPVEEILDEWDETFRSICDEKEIEHELVDQFLGELEQIVFNAESIIKRKIVDAIVLGRSQELLNILDEKDLIQHNMINVGLSSVYKWSISYFEQEIPKLITELLEDSNG